MRTFVSYTSVDRPFAEWLANTLTGRGISTWYDEWEIKVGDSIVQKLNAGLAASDFLVVVLTKASVASKWVAEELAAGHAATIEGRGVQILPVLKEECDVPPLLSHRKYADFRHDSESGMKALVEAIHPLRGQCIQLGALASEHERVVQRLRQLPASAVVGREILDLFRIMEDAALIRHDLATRTFRVESRRTPRFFEAVEFLSEHGVDVKSRTWNRLVELRNLCAHGATERLTKTYVARHFQSRYKGTDVEALTRALDRLSALMEIIARAPECRQHGICKGGAN